MKMLGASLESAKMGVWPSIFSGIDWLPEAQCDERESEFLSFTGSS